MLNNVVEIADFFMQQIVREGDSVIDATCGNGYDTLFLSDHVKAPGRVYAFDIQEKAIENTQKLLKEKGTYANVKLICDSHENLSNYIKEPISFSIFNLGYLPGSDKKITTDGIVTVKSIIQTIRLLKPCGVICVCAYLKHGGGTNEYDHIKTYLNSLDVDTYNVIEIKHLIRHEDAPRILMLEKK